MSTIETIARDHPAHRHLVRLLREQMSDISENYYFASWLIGLEVTLWNALHGGSREGAFERTISDEELRDLAELSALTGGWHDYDRFIPLDEWERTVKLRAGDPQ